MTILEFLGYSSLVVLSGAVVVFVIWFQHKKDMEYKEHQWRTPSHKEAMSNGVKEHDYHR